MESERSFASVVRVPTVLNFWSTGTFSSLGGANWIGAYGVDMRQYHLSEDLVKAKSGHKFGFGASLERTWWTVPPNTVNAVGQLNPQTLDAFYQGGFDAANSSVDFTSLTLPAVLSGRDGWRRKLWVIRFRLMNTLKPYTTAPKVLMPHLFSN